MGLFPRQGRTPTGVTTLAHAHVTNTAGYVQEAVSLLEGHLLVSGGLRYDGFRYNLEDRVESGQDGTLWSGRWQTKGTMAYTPWHAVPVMFHANYGRGINSVDARAVVYRPDGPRLGATDFFQTGMSAVLGPWSWSATLS